MFKKCAAFCLSLLSALTVFAFPVSARAEVSGENAETLRLPIVMYHHMSPKERLWGTYVLPVDQFERDLVYFKENGYETISASQLIAWSEGESELPEKPVMITFDDGYESTYVYAMPLLEKYGMTAVVSVIGSVAEDFTETPDHMLDYSHMSWEQIADAEKSGVLDIQCHTWDMHRLSPRRGCDCMNGESSERYRAALSDDLSHFQSEFSAHTGRTAEALALPYGSYSDETISLCSELGFRAIFTCTEQVNHLSRCPSSLLTLCRYNRPYGPDSASFFKNWE